MQKQLRVGINGCGRIGRAILRQYFALKAPGFQIVVMHDLMPLAQLHYLLRYDSVHGRLGAELNLVEKPDQVGLQTPQGFIAYDASPNLPQWDAYTLDLVVDVSGVYSHGDQVLQHMKFGASKVLLGAPLLNAKSQLYRKLPVYAKALKPGDAIDLSLEASVFTAYSCTTQALWTLLFPLMSASKFTDGFPAIRSMLVTELHGFTAGQALVDQAHRDWRRGRSAPESMIPTATQGIFGVEHFFPELCKKVAGYSIRVPVPNVAAVDVSLQLAQPITLEEVLDLYSLAQESLKGILALDFEQGVSVDYIGRTESAILAGDLCQVVGDQLRLYAWYDNEYGYANRILNALQNHTE